MKSQSLHYSDIIAREQVPSYYISSYTMGNYRPMCEPDSLPMHAILTNEVVKYRNAKPTC